MRPRNSSESADFGSTFARVERGGRARLQRLKARNRSSGLR